MNDNNKKPHAKEISRRRVYDGYFGLDHYVIELDKHDGGKMQVERLMLERGDSVAILAYDPRLDKVLMIEQFSPGAFVRGDKHFDLTLPAGSINKGEDAIAAARRELKEETGLDAQALTVLHTGAYPSAGSSSERVALVLAVVDMSKAGGVHGAPGEDEDLKSVVLDASAFIAAAERGTLRDFSSLIAGLQLARHRLQLRRVFNTATKCKVTKPAKVLRIKKYAAHGL